MNNSERSAYEYNYIMNLIHNIQNRYSSSYWGVRCYGSGARYLRKLTNALRNCSKQEYLQKKLGYFSTNPYGFQIYYVSGDTLYLRVAVTPEYHAHKRSPYYEYREISISHLTEIFYKEVIEMKRQKLEQLEMRKKALNREIYQINKEIAEINESLEKY